MGVEMNDYPGYPVVDVDPDDPPWQLIHERIDFKLPINEDVVVLMKIRYWRRGSGALTELRSEYGGFNDQWHTYQGFDVLDLNASGVLVFNGMEWLQLKDTILEHDRRTREQLEDARNWINKTLAEVDAG